MNVPQVIRKFCETTTIRGIGRAVKSESKFLLVVWWLSVTCCTTFMAYQLYLVLSRYLRYDYQIVDREASERPTFPDITFCNVVNPLGTSSENKSWDKYQSYMEGMQSRWTFEELQQKMNKLTKDDYDQLWIDLMSPTGYYANFPTLQTTSINKSDATSIDANYFNTIADINVFDWSWTYDDYSTTYSLEKIILKWNANYHHCYTLQLPAEQLKNVRAMSFVVYVDDFNSFIADKIEVHPRRSMSTGIRVAVHERGISPEFSTGLSAGPGTETSIIVNPVSRQRLEKPYDGCSNRQSPSGGDSLYTTSYCVKRCLQNTIIQKCGCLSSDLSFNTEQLKRANYTMCRNQTWLENNEANPTSSYNELNELAAFNRIMCLYNTNLSYSNCINQCDPPCQALQYFTTNSHSNPWPHTSRHLPFYDQYIKGTDYSDNFAEYAAINNKLKEKVISKEEAFARLRKLDIIERNFLQVNVVLQDYVYTTLNEVPSMPSEVLLSNVGGVLSLWLGVTVMTIVEITEVIYFIVVTCYDQCRKKTKPSVDHKIAMNGESESTK